MKLLENKKVSVLITLILIFMSIFIIGGNDIKRKQNEINEMFFYNDNLASIGEEVNRILGQSSNAITILERYIYEDSNYLNNLIEARDNLALASNPHEKYIAVSEVNKQINIINNEMENFNMSEQDINFLRGIVANIESSNRIIENNNYNLYAEEFNEMLRKFPTNIISRFRRIGPNYLYK